MNTEKNIKTFIVKKPLKLDCGKTIKDFPIAYETFGSLNSKKDNAILVFHALTGDQFVTGINPVTNKEGWWSYAVGPDKAIDTNKYFVICSNVIGGCMGSYGPSHKNPDQKIFGTNFPVITINDMVNAQYNLLDHFSIDKLFSITGGSMGGMQVLQFISNFPDKSKTVIPIATTSSHSAQNIAFNELGRQAITADSNWKDGNYTSNDTNPGKGLAVARMAAHITYLSKKGLQEKFGRKLQEREDLKFGFDADFQIESYLRYQGEKFVTSFDANTYLLMTKALDYFDPFNEIDFVERMSKSRSRFLVISFTSDWRFPPRRSEEIVKTLIKLNKDVSYACIKSDGGHDAFLMKNDNYFEIMRTYIEANMNG